MVLSHIQIFTYLGFGTATTRNVLRNDFLSGGLVELEHMLENDVKDACTSYAKQTDSPFPIIMRTLQKQRMKALMLWVKDMIRAQVDVDFEDGTTRSQFNAALKAVLDMEQMRRDQRKSGESFLDYSFNNKLKSQAKWD